MAGREPIRRLLVGCAVLTAGVLLHARQRDLPSAPGKLFDVGGGRRLHAICTGTGAPAVVIEAGASSFAIDFTLVQRQIEKTSRVCSYDRAGHGWSDDLGDKPSTTARDLKAMLQAAGERAPYVLVGASRGGLLIRNYLLEYPDDVAGLVFVDPSSEDRLFTMIDGKAMAIAEVTAEQLKTTFPKEDVKVPRRKPQVGTPFDRLPPDLYRIRIALDERLIASTPDTVPASVVATSQERERAMLARLLATRSAKHPFGDRPTVVLSRGSDPNAEREAVHAALAQLSSRGRSAVIAGAGHEIHLFEPDAVVKAINEVADAVRRGRGTFYVPRKRAPAPLAQDRRHDSGR
jgi:pimeloyl-ACP methyl ester carboxylesterase